MADNMHYDKRFGELAIEKQWITQDNIERALVIRRAIFNRTKVHAPIGRVLHKMGLLTEEQIEQILAEQNNGSSIQKASESPEGQELIHSSNVFDLKITDDKLSAFLIPTGLNHKNVTIGDIHQLLDENGVSFGVVNDSLLLAYLEADPLPPDPFKIAGGIAPEPGVPPEIQYHFDTDPLRIGTLKEDGTMDWRDRGEIPQVAAGDVLVEKIGGAPGKAGTDVFGEEVPPPKIKDTKIKCNKGAQTSPDGQQIIAKISGMPKLEADGRVAVHNILPIEGDIGLETGHVEFDGHIEVRGSVNSGYQVKGKSLSTNEIQDAVFEMNEDVVSYGGIYGSTLKVDGSLKANHIHHCTDRKSVV